MAIEIPQIELLGVGYTAQFEQFLLTYSTEELRHDMARKIADPAVELPDMNTSRQILAAHWGEDNHALGRIAESIYTLKTNVAKRVGETVISFTKGDPEAVSSPTGYLEDSIEIEIGRLGENELHNRFATRQPKDRNTPPALVFGVSLTVYDRFRIRSDGFEPYITDYQPGRSLMPSYRGAVPIGGTADVEQYDKLKIIGARPLIWGNLNAYKFLQSFIARTVTSSSEQSILQARERFMSLIAAGALKPGYPLPPMTHVFKPEAAPEEVEAITEYRAAYASIRSALYGATA